MFRDLLPLPEEINEPSYNNNGGGERLKEAIVLCIKKNYSFGLCIDHVVCWLRTLLTYVHQRGHSLLLQNSVSLIK